MTQILIKLFGPNYIINETLSHFFWPQRSVQVKIVKDTITRESLRPFAQIHVIIISHLDYKI